MEQTILVKDRLETLKDSVEDNERARSQAIIHVAVAES